jgi:hypothetical protein
MCRGIRSLSRGLAAITVFTSLCAIGCTSPQVPPRAPVHSDPAPTSQHPTPPAPPIRASLKQPIARAPRYFRATPRSLLLFFQQPGR